MEYVYLIMVATIAIVQCIVCYDEKEIKIILGSSSSARKQLLDTTGIDYISISPDIDENAIMNKKPEELVIEIAKSKTIVNDNPEKLVIEIAKAKTAALKDKLAGQDCILITADQLVLTDKILGKPANIKEAKRFLKSYSNNVVKTITGLVVTNMLTNKSTYQVDISTIYFDEITKEDIEEACVPEMPINIMEKTSNFFFLPVYIPLKKQLVVKEEVNIMDCCGGLAIEHPVLYKKIRKIEGSYSSILGLPLKVLIELISEVI